MNTAWSRSGTRWRHPPWHPGEGAMRHVLEIGKGTNHPLAGLANGECAKVVPGPTRAKAAMLCTPPGEEALVMLFRSHEPPQEGGRDRERAVR